MMTPKAAPRTRRGIKNEQLVAERIVAGMMAKDAFSQWLGLSIVDVGPRKSTVRATIRPDMVNGFGVAHGGIAFSIADSAFAFACNTHGKVTMSIENSITYPIAVNVGDVVTAEAELESESNKISYYRVVVTNQKGDVVALFRGTAFKTKNDHGTAKSGTADNADDAGKAADKTKAGGTAASKASK